LLDSASLSEERENFKKEFVCHKRRMEQDLNQFRIIIYIHQQMHTIKFNDIKVVLTPMCLCT